MMASAASYSSILASLEGEVSSLTVEKLKSILRQANLPVSGNKPLLISRIKGELRKLAHPNAGAKFERLRSIISSVDRPAAPSIASPSPGYSSSAFAPSPRFGSQANGCGASQHRPPSIYGQSFESEMRFTESPFFEVIEKVSPRFDLDTREHSRDSKDFRFRIRGDILERLRQDKQLRVLLYCATDEALRSAAHISFPNSFDIRVNDHEVRGNFKGLKNKPGTTRPADVTSQLRKHAHQDNSISLTWALTTRRFNVIFQLVRQFDPESLVRKLREAKRITKASVLQEMNSWNADDDIVATESRMSLKCPLSTLRIQTPCRSKRCKHNQCFDALSFLQLQEQAPQWTCPVCNQQVPFDILQVDEYVDDILKNSPQSAEQVTVDPNGNWSLVAETAATDSGSEPPVKREGTDLSDDIVEVAGPVSGSSHRTPATSFPPHMGNFGNGAFNSTASNGQNQASSKRPAAAVIDLTLDSDDDEDLPIRHQAKRQNLGNSIGSNWPQDLVNGGLPPQFSPNQVRFPLPRQRGSLPSETNFHR